MTRRRGCSAIFHAFACWLAFAIWLIAPDAHARPREQKAVALFEDLTPAQRALLAAAAALPDPAACARGPCSQLDALDPKWRDSLRRIVGRLAGFGSWKAAALANVLPSEIGSFNEARPRLTRYATDLGKFLRKQPLAKECEEASRQLADVAAKRKSEHTLFEASLGKPYGGTAQCFEASLKSQGLPLKLAFEDMRDQHMVALTLVDDPKTTVHVALLSSDPEFFEVTDFVPIDGMRVYLVPIRHQARATFRIETPNAVVPDIRTLSIDDTTPVIARIRDTRCVEWDISPEAEPTRDPTRTVYFDGVPITDRTVAVRESIGPEEIQTHDLFVVETSATGPPVILDSLSIPAKQLPLTGCFRARFDLRSNDDGRDVAILNATAEPSCMAAGIDSQRVRGRVERFLVGTKRRAQDTKNWADTATSFAELAAQLRTLGEPAVGASRGRLATRSLLGSGAAELERQGFSSLVSVNLTCTLVEKAWDFAIRATVIKVKDLLQPRDDVNGLDLNGVARSELEVSTGLRSLDAAMVGALSRVLGEPYLRFDGIAERRSFQSRVSEQFRVFIPEKPTKRGAARDDDVDDYVVELEAHRFREEQDAFHVCSTVESAQSLRSAQRASDWWKTQTANTADGANIVVTPRANEEGAYEIVWAPRDPGRYLVRAQLLRHHDDPLAGETIAYRCVEIDNTPTRLSFDASYGVNTPLTIGHEGLAGTLHYVQFMLGLSRATSTYSNLDVGIALGYADAIHSREAPPSWELAGAAASNVAGPRFERDGRLPLTWTRQSVQLGPMLTYHVPAPLCAIKSLPCSRALRAFSILGRLTPVFDIGKIDASSIPSELRKFTQNADGLNVTVSTFLQAGLHGQIGPEKSLYVLGNLGLIGWSDYVLGGRNQDIAQSRITYEANMTFGVTVGAEYDL
jgi:hypothetical protein